VRLSSFSVLIFKWLQKLLSLVEKITMKITAMHWVAITTLLLITVTIFATMNLAFNWIFYITMLGQASVVVMVYKVLKDNYVTDKTFKDRYEDFPQRGRS
jgi:hypothetical protein